MCFVAKRGRADTGVADLRHGERERPTLGTPGHRKVSIMRALRVGSGTRPEIAPVK
jgi:hypothetical protein